MQVLLFVKTNYGVRLILDTFMQGSSGKPNMLKQHYARLSKHARTAAARNGELYSYTLQKGHTVTKLGQAKGECKLLIAKYESRSD